MIKIENSKVNGIANFLNKVSLSGKASRYRTKLLINISEVITNLARDEKKIVEEYDATVDKNGFIKVSDDSEKSNQMRQELSELKSDRAILNEQVEGQFKTLYKTLDDYSNPLAGQDAQAYDDLMEALEEGGYDEQSN